MAPTYTPMMEQYREIKRAHQTEILFFRLGDFYEMFFEDAVLASRELEITLTSRDGGAAERIPMCGIPFHAADNYIAKLIGKGYKVAICEQVEDPKLVKGLVRREVIKVITPGTFIAENAVVEPKNNFLTTVYEADGIISAASADIATGECIWASFRGDNRITELCDFLAFLKPAELVTAGRIKERERLAGFINTRLSSCAKSDLVVNEEEYANLEQLTDRFTASEVPANDSARLAVQYLLLYLSKTVKCDVSHINRLTAYNPAEYVSLDASTQRNLELTRNMRDNSKKGTLLDILDFTATAMGGRLLRKWIEQPLVQTSFILERQDAVSQLHETPARRKALHEFLQNIYDMERILARVEIGTVNARDLIALKNSLEVLPGIRNVLSLLDSRLMHAIELGIQTHADIFNLIHTAINDQPPLSTREGGMIRSGYDLELDELRSLSSDSKHWLQNVETREREQTGIKSLKLGYNKVFGYYLEVTNTHTASVPAHYIRKQTLVNAERYITPELKEFETKILGAQEKIASIEYHIFMSIRDYIKARIPELQETARHIAHLDALVSLSEAAARYNYTKPSISTNREIIIRDGRHPVVERLSRDMFVPNDTNLNHKDTEVMIITGPNMAGKSTYMRQAALLVLMAQIGSFIPAREACISPVDKIFTRVGASDDLATGQSTFMVEMNEVGHILQYATQNSLVILDEIGRGTSTFDGMSIARAVIEYIRDRIKAKTLFATHYHELTDLEAESPTVKNYRVAVKERGNEVVFLHRIIPGSADKSYGIHVAQLAGLPKKVIDRAHEILIRLESCQVLPEAAATVLSPSRQHDELTLFQHSVNEELRNIDIMSMTPIEALNVLFRLQKLAKEETGSL